MDVLRLRDPCPIAPVVELLLGRWTAPLMWTLEHHGRMRFTELRLRLAPVTAKVLTQRLRDLARDGLVTRTYHPEVPPRVEYEITDLGRTLKPLFVELAAWSERHLPEVAAARGRHARPLAAGASERLVGV